MLKINKMEALKYIEIFLLIQLTLGPLNTSYKLILYIILLLLNGQYLKELMKTNRFWSVFFLVAIIPLVFDILNVDSITPYSLAGWYYFFPFVVCKVWVIKYKNSDFFYYFEKIAYFCCIISLIGYALIFIAPNVIEYFPTIDYGGRDGGVHTIVIYNALRRAPGLPGFLFRNCGIAFEPGAFQFVPNLALAYILGNKKIKLVSLYFRATIYILTVASTLSTTGIVILALVILVNVFNKRNMFYFTIGGIIVSPAIIYVILDQMNKLGTGNFMVRFGNSLYVLQNYSHNIFGIGSTNYNKIYAMDRTIGSWDIYTNLFLRFGWIFVVLFIYLNIRLYKLGKGIMIVCLITFLTESLIGPITVMLYYYCEKKYLLENTEMHLNNKTYMLNERMKV